MKIYFYVLLLVANIYLAKGQSSQDLSTHLILKFDQNFRGLEIDENGLKFSIEKLDILNDANGLYAIKIIHGNSKDATVRLSFNKVSELDLIIKAYLKLGIFEYVEPDYIGFGGGYENTGEVDPNDAFFYRQWSLFNDGSFILSPAVTGADLQMKDAWEISQGSEEIVVAILDSGVNFSHPDLEGRIWSNPGEPDQTSDADKNGYLGDIRGWDFVNVDNNPFDDFGHGTNVTGIVGANGNNSIGYSGVDWNCKLMICKILDENNSGFYSWWVEAIYYATDNGAKVINMSVGGSSFSNAMQDAISYATEKGVIVIACMMNENSEESYYPAAYSETIAVGSTDPDDQRSNSFPWNVSKGSNYGDHIDITAPGNYIYGLSHNDNSNYGTYWSGTSQATPHVTGIVALMLALDSSLDTESVREILRNTADDQVGKSSEDSEGWDKYHGSGRLNAYNALQGLSTSVSIVPYSSDFYLRSNKKIAGQDIDITLSYEVTGHFSLTNISGSVINRYLIDSKEIRIPTSNLSSGIYLITLMEKNKRPLTKRIFID